MVWLTFRLKSVALHRTPRLFANFPVIVNSTIWAIQSAAVNMLIYFVNDRFVTGSLVCLRGPELFRVVNLPRWLMQALRCAEARAGTKHGIIVPRTKTPAPPIIAREIVNR